MERLARVGTEHGVTLVHVSSGYVLDGCLRSYGEGDPPCPPGVHGQNFVAAMAGLARSGVNPSVVNDQAGRLSFTGDIAAGIVHLLESGAPFGTCNLANDGEPASRARIAKQVFALCGHDPARVNEIGTADYFAGRPDTAPRPASSTLRLEKIRGTGFPPADQLRRLAAYVEEP